MLEDKIITSSVDGETFTTKDSGAREQFDTGMHRDTSMGKIRYDLMYIPMLKRYAALMTRGAEKYGEDNWKLAKTHKELKRFKESAFRHFMQWYLGEVDEDHASAVWFNIAGAEYTKKRIEENKNEIELRVTFSEEDFHSLMKLKNSDTSGIVEHILNMLEEKKKNTEREV